MLSADELETILIIARNRQSGRITEFEVKALVAGYQEADRLRSQGGVPAVPFKLENDMRSEVAGIVERVGDEGLDQPRDLDAALDAIESVIAGYLAAGTTDIIARETAAAHQPPLSAGAAEYQSGADVPGEPDSRAPKSVNSHGIGGHSGSPTPPVDGLREALARAQRALAALVTPGEIRATSILQAWAMCVEAEWIARAALASTPAPVGTADIPNRQFMIDAVANAHVGARLLENEALALLKILGMDPNEADDLLTSQREEAGQP